MKYRFCERHAPAAPLLLVALGARQLGPKGQRRCEACESRKIVMEVKI